MSWISNKNHFLRNMKAKTEKNFNVLSHNELFTFAGVNNSLRCASKDKYLQLKNMLYYFLSIVMI